MYSYWNAPPYQPIRHPMYSERVETEQLIQRISNLESQMNQLIKLMEQNNQLLQAMDEQKNKVCTTGGGGAVIVRM